MNECGGYELPRWGRRRDAALEGPFAGEPSMSTIIFTASRHRVTVRGLHLEADLPYLLDALRCFGPHSGWLVLDLTHVRILSRHVTSSLLQVCSELEVQGVELRILTRPSSAAERMLEAGRASRPGPGSRVPALVGGEHL
jgi:hypothetical protein